MSARWITPFLVTSFCILTLSLLYVSRRPLCIDSRVVERIDRGQESVFKCNFNKHIPFSPYFTEHLHRIEARIQQIESFIDTVAPYKTRIRIVIVKGKPTYFLVKDNVIYIGEDLLEARGHIEKALLKVWYRENNQNLFAYDTLFEEVYTDFLLYLAKGNLKIEDPYKGLRTHLGGSRWPQVLKSLQAYCDSPWKNSEHYQFCSQMEKQPDSPVRDQISELSLRPLLISAWITSYEGLSFREQHQFIKNLRSLISGPHDPELPIVRTGAWMSTGSPLQEAGEAIKNTNYFLTTSSLMKESSAQRVFVTLVSNTLNTYGYKTEGLGGAYFDLLMINEGKIDTKSEQFKQLLALSKQNPNLKIALKDAESLWMLPSVYPVHWKSLSYLRADRTVYNKCGTYDFNFVWQFSEMTEKLMILNVCDFKNINLAGYIKDGPEAFGMQNQNISFIQFHIPSLLMRKEQLSRVDNVYDLIKKREIENPVFQSLGWQEIRWSEKAQAYQPKSFIDGIEWFRSSN